MRISQKAYVRIWCPLDMLIWPLIPNFFVFWPSLGSLEIFLSIEPMRVFCLQTLTSISKLTNLISSTFFRKFCSWEIDFLSSMVHTQYSVLEHNMIDLKLKNLRFFAASINVLIYKRVPLQLMKSEPIVLDVSSI